MPRTPKCKVCRQRHSLAEGHQYGDGAAIMVSPDQVAPCLRVSDHLIEKQTAISKEEAKNAH